MMENLSLQKILEAFNSPINEEQAWAVCYQCAKYLKGPTDGSIIDRLADQDIADTLSTEGGTKSFTNGLASSDGDDGDRVRDALNSRANDTILPVPHASDGIVKTSMSEMVTPVSVLLSPDGNIFSVNGYTSSILESADAEKQLVKALGVMIFQALDFGLSEAEEQRLTPALEQLIEQMTNGEGADEQPVDRDVEGDEGIEDDADDKENGEKFVGLGQVIKICADHVENSVDAANHYKAVCRALVAEAVELSTFLDRIYDERERLQVIADESMESPLHHLEALKRTDWARLWIQIMKELRHGVKLKKVQTTVTHPVEYELTPYEILMDDVRYRRYTLNKVPLNEDMMPQKVKKDVHAIILEFIRSRPPLHPANNRRLLSPPVKSPDVREQLMEAIRSEPRLKPTPGRIVETSRTKLDEADSTPKPSKKIIKPDLALLMSNSFDEDCENDSDDDFDDKNRVTAEPVAPFTPLSPKSPPRHLPWQQTALDLMKIPSSNRPERRHSITICETPRSVRSPAPKTSLQSSLECLSLTVEEVMHIRNVLTKAELECLSVDPELHSLLSSGKVCFTCKKTRFSLFGTWATTCKFCRRNVCSQCVRKMRIPTEHFEHIPVYTLSPSPGSPLSEADSIYDITGSVPSSPDFSRKLSSPQTGNLANVSANGNLAKLAAMTLGNVSQSAARIRAPLQRSQTSVRPPPAPARTLEGPMMNICRDCRAMIVNVIRASRRSLAMAPQGNMERVYSDCPSRKPSRNFHLDLKPVYKERKA